MANLFMKMLLLMGLAAGGVQAAELLDEAAFTRLMANRIESLGLGIEVVVSGPLTIELADADQKTSTISLDNAYAEFKSEPDSLEFIVGKFVAVAKATFLPSKAASAESLMPVVRDLEYIKALQEHTRKSSGEHEGDELAFLPLFGELGLVFAFNSEESMRFATWQEIDKLGVPRRDVLAFALNNLQQISSDPQIVEFDGFVGIDSGGPFQSSLFLSDGFWQQHKFAFNGDLVAFPVTRDAIFLTGSGEVEGLKAARAMALQWMSDNAYPMSAQPIVRRGGKWSVFEE